MALEQLDGLCIADYEDVRLELQNTACNLTSVLMNPRDTMYDEIMDDIWDDFTSDASTTNSTASSSHGGLVSSDSLLSLSGHSGNGKNSHGNPSEVDESMSYLQQSFHHYENIHAENKQVQGNQGQRTLLAESHAATCFRDVPDIFFHTDFTMNQTWMFEQGATSSDNISNSSSSSSSSGSSSRGAKSAKSASSGHGHMKKLNEYLDLVECALLQQIASRSGDIFSALDDIKGQQDQVASAIAKLETLHSHLRKVDEKVASSAVHIPLMHRRRNNQAQLLQKLSCMQRVLEGKGSVQALLEAGDYLGALDLLEGCKELYNQELTAVTSMKRVGEQLDVFDNFVCEVISNRFVSQAIEWEEGGACEELSELEKLAAVAGESSVPDDTGLSLGQLMQALLLINKLEPAFNMYKNRLVEGLKLIVRTCVTEYMTGSDSITSDIADDADTGTSSNVQPFAKRIRAMPIEQFLSCVIICFEHLLKALQRANRVHIYMLRSLKQQDSQRASGGEADRALDSMPGSEGTIAVADASGGEGENGGRGGNTESLQELSKLCLISACDIAQRALSQLLLMRKADAARLSLSSMQLLWKTASHFASSVEEISESSAYIMRQALQQQTVAFLAHIHEQAKLKLASTMNTEKWVQCDVPTEKQQQIDKLASGKAFLKGSSSNSTLATASATATATTLTSASNNGSMESLSTAEDAATNASASVNGNSNQKIASKRRGRDITPVTVDGVPFKVVWSSLLLLEMVMSYLEIAIGFPAITSEVITMTKEMIQFFNKQTLALVLGSGAQKSQAQLRSISAKHLTVTAQSLGLVLAMLPHTRAAFLTQLPPNRSMQLTELDRVSQELLEHHSQILTKFVIILGDSIDASAPKLASVNWDTSTGQTEYFEDVSKNVTALHRVLLLDAMLPLEQVQDIFTRIFALLLRKIPSHFDNVSPQTITGKQRILDEVTHLTASFSLLKSVDSSTEMAQLEEALKRKFRM